MPASRDLWRYSTLQDQPRVLRSAGVKAGSLTVYHEPLRVMGFAATALTADNSVIAERHQVALIDREKRGDPITGCCSYILPTKGELQGSDDFLGDMLGVFPSAEWRAYGLMGTFKRAAGEGFAGRHLSDPAAQRAVIDTTVVYGAHTLHPLLEGLLHVAINNPEL